MGELGRAAAGRAVKSCSALLEIICFLEASLIWPTFGEKKITVTASEEPSLLSISSAESGLCGDLNGERCWSRNGESRALMLRGWRCRRGCPWLIVPQVVPATVKPGLVSFRVLQSSFPVAGDTPVMLHTCGCPAWSLRWSPFHLGEGDSVEEIHHHVPVWDGWLRH